PCLCNRLGDLFRFPQLDDHCAERGDGRVDDVGRIGDRDHRFLARDMGGDGLDTEVSESALTHSKRIAQMSERLALITGTSSGIGAAVARGLLKRGWTVVGIARRKVKFGGHYEHLALDLSDAAAAKKIENEF